MGEGGTKKTQPIQKGPLFGIHLPYSNHHFYHEELAIKHYYSKWKEEGNPQSLPQGWKNLPTQHIFVNGAGTQ